MPKVTERPIEAAPPVLVATLADHRRERNNQQTDAAQPAEDLNEIEASDREIATLERALEELTNLVNDRQTEIARLNTAIAKTDGRSTEEMAELLSHRAGAQALLPVAVEKQRKAEQQLNNARSRREVLEQEIRGLRARIARNEFQLSPRGSLSQQRRDALDELSRVEHQREQTEQKMAADKARLAETGAPVDGDLPAAA